MIIDELKSDIHKALSIYLKKTSPFKKLPRERQMDIIIISNILKGEDAIKIVKELTTYLKQISLPFFISFLTFIDLNYFIAIIKNVLDCDKYQLVNLMQSMIGEKEEIITLYKKRETGVLSSKQVPDLILEINLLKRENQFLYETLDQLEQKIQNMNSNLNFLKTQNAVADVFSIKEDPPRNFATLTS